MIFPWNIHENPWTIHDGDRCDKHKLLPSFPPPCYPRVLIHQEKWEGVRDAELHPGEGFAVWH